MATFSQRLTSLRESQNLSKAETARRLDIPVSTYSNYEYGNREPDFETLNRIAKHYHVTVDYLLGRSEPSQENKHVTETVEQALSHVMSFDGKPVTDHDRAVLQQIAEAYLKGRDPDEDNQ